MTTEGSLPWTIDGWCRAIRNQRSMSSAVGSDTSNPPTSSTTERRTTMVGVKHVHPPAVAAKKLALCSPAKCEGANPPVRRTPLVSYL